MDSRNIDKVEEQTGSDTPEDVAILYSWANLHGAKYRDFSASRREYRAQVRHRAAESLRERELKAQADAEAAAAAAERSALAAEAAARSQNTSDSQTLRTQSLQSAEAAARRAAAERVEAARRAEAAANAEAVARREEREIAEAHASAQRQAANYADSEVRRRHMAGPQPRGPLPGQMSDPYMPGSLSGDSRPERSSAARQFLQPSQYEEPVRPRPQGYRPDVASGVWQTKPVPRPPETPAPAAPVFSQPVAPASWTPPAVASSAPAGRVDTTAIPGSIESVPSATKTYPVDPAPAFSVEAPLDPQPDRAVVPAVVAPGDTSAGPAWLYEPQIAPRTRTPVPAAPGYGSDTLQNSRERVAARWFALKGVFDNTGPELPALQPIKQNDARTPLLAVFSLSGGVGKTSLVATLGRAFSSMGEKVLLTDTTSHGLLPFYFGARELRPGVVRTFSPPTGSMDAAINLVSYDVDQKGSDDAAQEKIAEEIVRNSRGNHRVLLDVPASSSWVVRRMAGMHPTILVPMSPDMNSVISLQSVEKFFQGIVDSDGHPLQPFYVLNQFDASLPLHLDVREVFRRQLGERLLRFVIRRSPAVSEALAEGMTVVDYAPEAPVSQDYLDVAKWLRSVSAPATAGFRNVRWR